MASSESESRRRSVLDLTDIRACLFRSLDIVTDALMQHIQSYIYIVAQKYPNPRDALFRIYTNYYQEDTGP